MPLACLVPGFACSPAGVGDVDCGLVVLLFECDMDMGLGVRVVHDGGMAVGSSPLEAESGFGGYLCDLAAFGAHVIVVRWVEV